MVNRDAVRGQVLLEESREAVVVLDEAGVVLAASRRARQLNTIAMASHATAQPAMPPIAK